MKPEDLKALKRLRLRQRESKAKVERAAVTTVAVLCAVCVALSFYVLN